MGTTFGQLPPCPFCTGTPVKVHLDNGPAVKCSSCGAMMPGTTTTSAEFAWSRRAAPQQATVGDERLAEVGTLIQALGTAWMRAIGAPGAR